ncbi:hypothetical protein M885DRAFT_622035 [Pelagophyceae sp. CCMP2097]|nr:hypothetical protein M885DRAFT_622035 [Pelagophyceae sp. CCMP2097]
MPAAAESVLVTAGYQTLASSLIYVVLPVVQGTWRELCIAASAGRGFKYCFNTLVGFVEVKNVPVENLRFVIANSEAQAVSGIFVPSCHSYLEEKRAAFKTRAFNNAPAGATVALAAKRGRGADERGPTTKDLFMKKFPGGIYMSDDSVALELIKLFGVGEVTFADRLEAAAKVSE